MFSGEYTQTLCSDKFLLLRHFVAVKTDRFGTTSPSWAVENGSWCISSGHMLFGSAADLSCMCALLSVCLRETRPNAGTEIVRYGSTVCIIPPTSEPYLPDRGTDSSVSSVFTVYRSLCPPVCPLWFFHVFFHFSSCFFILTQVRSHRI